jgi:hypothetical protein
MACYGDTSHWRDNSRLSQIPGPIANYEFFFPDADQNRIGQTLGQMIEFSSVDGVVRVPCRAGRRHDDGRPAAGNPRYDRT